MAKLRLIVIIGDRMAKGTVPYVEGSSYYISPLVYRWNSDTKEVEQCNETSLTGTIGIEIGMMNSLGVYNDGEFCYMTHYSKEFGLSDFIDSDGTPNDELISLNTKLTEFKRYCDNAQLEYSIECVVTYFSLKDCYLSVSDWNSHYDESGYQSRYTKLIELLSGSDYCNNENLVAVNKVTDVPYASTFNLDTEFQDPNVQVIPSRSSLLRAQKGGFIIPSNAKYKIFTHSDYQVPGALINNSSYIPNEGTRAILGQDGITFTATSTNNLGKSLANTILSALDINVYLEYLDINLYSASYDIDAILFWNEAMIYTDEELYKKNYSDYLALGNAIPATRISDSLFTAEFDPTRVAQFYYILLFKDNVYRGSYKFKISQSITEDLKVVLNVNKEIVTESTQLSSNVVLGLYKAHVGIGSNSDEYSINYNFPLSQYKFIDNKSTISIDKIPADEFDNELSKLATTRSSRLTNVRGTEGDSMLFDSSSGYSFARDRDTVAYGLMIKFWNNPTEAFNFCTNKINNLGFTIDSGFNITKFIKSSNLGCDPIRGLYLYSVIPTHKVIDGEDVLSIFVVLIGTGCNKQTWLYKFTSSPEDTIHDTEVITNEINSVNQFIEFFTCGYEAILKLGDNVYRLDTPDNNRRPELVGHTEVVNDISYVKYYELTIQYKIYTKFGPGVKLIIPRWFDMWYILILLDTNDESIRFLPCSGDLSLGVLLEDATESNLCRLQNGDAYPGPKYEINNISMLYKQAGLIMKDILNSTMSVNNIKTSDNSVIVDYGSVQRNYVLNYRGPRAIDFDPNIQYGISNQGRYVVTYDSEGQVGKLKYNRFIDEIKNENMNVSDTEVIFDSGLTADEKYLYYRGVSVVVSPNEITLKTYF